MKYSAASGHEVALARSGSRSPLAFALALPLLCQPFLCSALGLNWRASQADDAYLPSKKILQPYDHLYTDGKWMYPDPLCVVSYL